MSWVECIVNRQTTVIKKLPHIFAEFTIVRCYLFIQIHAEPGRFRTFMHLYNISNIILSRCCFIGTAYFDSEFNSKISRDKKKHCLRTQERLSHWGHFAEPISNIGKLTNKFPTKNYGLCTSSSPPDDFRFDGAIVFFFFITETVRVHSSVVISVSSASESDIFAVFTQIQ